MSTSTTTTTTITSRRDFRPTPTDGYHTPTSSLQAQTEAAIQHQLRLSTSASATTSPTTAEQPLLQRQPHLQFLVRNLQQGFPERYVSQDASQPWLVFWTLQALSVLGVALDDHTKKKARETLLAFQHPDGGFAGGPGQSAHLLPTYAAVCGLAIAGDSSPDGAWDAIDRDKMYKFFMSLKQPDGSFHVSHDGEVDVRGIYCLLVTATLLNMLTPELIADVPAFVASCQTYEGGFCNASFPDWALASGNGISSADPSIPRPPLGEAHGGYTFCSTASWALLSPSLSLTLSRSDLTSPSTPQSHPQINLPALTRWVAQMQGGPVELGGFRGRTNKLVDGCYSWWVGGCAAVVDGLLVAGGASSGAVRGESGVEERRGGEEVGEEVGEKECGVGVGKEVWDDVVDDALYDRFALQEYILYAGQHPAGGLRDKPPKPADAYHTLYCLSGLSVAQHRVVPSHLLRAQLRDTWDTSRARERAKLLADANEGSDAEFLRRETFVGALCWAENEGEDAYAGGSVNRINATHPLFNMTVTHVRGIMAHFYGQDKDKLPNPPTATARGPHRTASGKK